jgi:iron only hydrogenase large subunit-like protein
MAESATRYQTISAVATTNLFNSTNMNINQPFHIDTHTYTDTIERHLPMFASSCPGWICYAEKTHPQCLPYISTTKSPQQILGTLMKEVLGMKDVFIVSVQPCFDKKLEASRKVSSREILR